MKAIALLLAAAPALAEAPRVEPVSDIVPVCYGGEVSRVRVTVTRAGTYVLSWPRNVCRLGDA
ncbi:MAG: hypothetical protein V4792_16645 [Pseudomonadota bacterium]